MKYRFRVTQKVCGYTPITEEYKRIEVDQNFECETFDDLKDIILTLVDYSTKDVKLEIHKEVIEYV